MCKEEVNSPRDLRKKFLNSSVSSVSSFGLNITGYKNTDFKNKYIIQIHTYTHYIDKWKDIQIDGRVFFT